MTASDRSSTANSPEPANARIGPMSLGAVVGACILALHSFSLQAEEDGDAAFSPMTGATLSALHAAIPAAADEDEPAPTF